jgi:hypothetical protein
MLRSSSIRALQAHLRAAYTGPVTILGQEDDGDLDPPYSVVRVGSAEDIGHGQDDVWDLNILVAVFNDAEECSAETAEARAAEVFSHLADPPTVAAALAPGIVVSWWQPIAQEAAIVEKRWQHVAAYRLVAAPAADA